MKNKSNAIFHNVLYNLLYQLILYASALVTIPYVSRILGAAQIGRFSYAQSISSYFVLFATLGSTLYGQRKIASVRGNPQLQERYFREIAAFRLFSSLLVATLYIVFLLPRCSYPLLYAIMLFQILGVGLDISWYFQGTEQFGLITGCSGLCRVSGILLVFVFVRTFDDLNRYAFLFFFSSFLGFFLQWFFLPHSFRTPHIVKPVSVGLHLLPTLSLFTAQVAIQIYTVLDKTMIGLITHSELENGYYEQSQKIIHVLVTLSTAMCTVVSSRVAGLWHDNKQEEAQNLTMHSFRALSAIATPIILGLSLVAKRFVPLFFGAGYDGVLPLLRVLAFQIAIIGCSNIIGVQYLIPSDRENLVTRSVTVGAVTNFVANLLLIPRWNALGACAASVLAEFLVTSCQFYYVRKELSLPTVLKNFGRYFLLSCPMFFICLVTNRLFPHSNLLYLVTSVLLCTLVYGSELLLLKDPCIQRILNRGNGRI